MVGEERLFWPYGPRGQDLALVRVYLAADDLDRSWRDGLARQRDAEQLQGGARSRRDRGGAGHRRDVERGVVELMELAVPAWLVADQ